ncbi:MAG: hypothetical protein N2053_02495 [Chitinispirillaceae bacterium]|nr:hypothetical protein [Chitinispirillaceae bacterium]
MKEFIQNISYLQELLREKINLLIVEDNEMMGKSLLNLFSSPLFKPVIATSICEAKGLLPQKNWHSWILDVALEEKESGLKLISENPNYPYIVVLSGIKSMSIASKAMRLGAFKVYDKKPSMLKDLYEDVCTLSTLAFLLKCKGTKYFSLFLVLSQMIIETAEKWAHQAFLTVRQLERICTSNSNLKPKDVLPLFYTFRFLLMSDSTSSVKQLLPTKESREFIAHCVDFVAKNIDTVYKEILCEVI